MKKMYAILSMALLMSGAMYADGTINVTNNTKIPIGVQINYQTYSPSGMCGMIGASASGFVDPEASGAVNYDDTCQKPVEVAVYHVRGSKKMKQIQLDKMIGQPVIKGPRQNTVTVTGDGKGNFTVQ